MTANAQPVPDVSKQGAEVSIRLLGRFEVHVRGEPVLDPSFSHSKARALVKLLALQESHALHRDKVYDQLWPDLDQKAASNNLRQTLHRLRTGLAKGGLFAPLVESEGDMVALRPDLSFDVDEFRELAAGAKKTRTDSQLYERALALYRGDLLPEDLYEDWTEPEREDLRELRNELLLQFADLLNLHGDKARSEAQLKELLRTEPLHEIANRRLMEAHARSGRSNRAIQHYRSYAATLKRQLDVQPSEETEALVEQIQAGELRPKHHPPIPTGIFVGREQEMEELRAGVNDALAGSGRLFMITGEPGIGKTRITEELAVYASLRGCRVLSGTCHEAEGVPPFWSWLQVLRLYARTADPDQLLRDLGTGINEIAQIVPELREWLPDSSRSMDGEPEARFRLYDAVSGFLKRVSNTLPLAIILEDLHWAHPSSIELLHFLARDMRDASLLVVGTYRAAEIDDGHPLTGVLAELNRESHYSRLQLEGLSPDDIGRYIKETVGVSLSTASVAAVHEKTEGNPFFATQVLSLIASDGSPGDKRDLKAADLQIPQGVTEVIGLRLDRLSEECRRILALASVIGREFGLGLLESVSELPREELLRTLSDAESAGVIESSRDELAEYRFSHDLIKATLYEGLGPAQRAHLHRRIGEVLENHLRNGIDVALSELAHHFSNGSLDNDPGKALEYCERAGDEAAARFAFEEAAEQFKRAHTAAKRSRPHNPRKSSELLTKAGDAYSRAGHATRASELLTMATTSAAEIGEDALQAEAALKLAAAVWRTTKTEEAVPVIDDALGTLAPNEDALRARLLASKSHALASQKERSLDLAREACQLADASGDDLARMEALGALEWALGGSPTAEQRLATLEELVRVARRTGHALEVVNWLRTRASVWVELGDIERAERDFDEADELQPGTTSPLYSTRTFPAMRALLRGNYHEAEQLLDEAIPLAAQLRNRNFRIATASQLFDLRRAQGRLDEMEEATLREIRDAPLAGAPSPISRLSFLYVETKRYERASEWFDTLRRNGFRGHHGDPVITAVVGYSANVVRRFGDTSAAGELYEIAKPYRTRTISAGALVYCGGSLSRSLGQLTATMGQWGDAVRHFEYALKYDERIEAWPWLARTRFEYASMLQERDASGDGEKAAALVDEALTTFEDIGMPKDRERALELKKLLKK